MNKACQHYTRHRRRDPSFCRRDTVHRLLHPPMARVSLLFCFAALAHLISAGATDEAMPPDCSSICGPAWAGTCLIDDTALSVSALSSSPNDAATTAISSNPATCSPSTGSNATFTIAANDTAPPRRIHHIGGSTAALSILALDGGTIPSSNTTSPCISLGDTFASDLTALTDLSITHLNLSMAPLPPLPPSLRSIRLSDTAVNAVDLSSIPNLTSLDLSRNRLDRIPASIYALPRLTSLNLSGNPIDATALSSSNLVFLNALASFQVEWTRCNASTTTLGWTSRQTAVVLAPCPPVAAALVRTDPASSSSNSLTLVLAGVGTGIFLLIIVVLVVMLRRRRHANLPRDPTMEQIHHTAFKSSKAAAAKAPTSILKQPTSLAGPSMSDAAFLAKYAADAELLPLRVPMDALVETRRVGHSRNGHYEVWVGQLEGRQVVLKKLAPAGAASTGDGDELPAARLLDEMRVLARLRHPHVVACLGVAWVSSTCACGVVEYMNQGDLRSVLDTAPLAWKDTKFEMALHVARALLYLHTQRTPVLIHRDVRAQNVLVHLPDDSDSRLVCKMTNFTSARARTFVDTMTQGVGSALWTAPEVLRGDDYSERVDIYSFGVVLCELDTHALPFDDDAAPCDDPGHKRLRKESGRSLVQDIMTGKAIPQFSPACPPQILHLAKQCLQLDPANRPTAAAIVDVLEKIVSEHEWVDRVTRTGGIYV
ncbi:Aste57867_23285 [Aphanomyces stellatus]|uniref:Aste57867_23285 protein n=1 Tax=Aphanomyces stellatus TaxID=120398 RepID=A0A485LMQ4_9STRA|nr:hypothetical protein As57867_023214 [Aphanomyces stellatus]VFT99930.1 Aste57867_23285 [Aphanomyces stellatus]